MRMRSRPVLLQPTISLVVLLSIVGIACNRKPNDATVTQVPDVEVEVQAAPQLSQGDGEGEAAAVDVGPQADDEIEEDEGTDAESNSSSDAVGNENASATDPQTASIDSTTEPPTDDEAAANETATDPSDISTSAPVEVAEVKVEPSRVLLMTADGPLVIDLMVKIDGQSQAQQVELLIDEVLKLADTDQDGVVNWQEAMTDPDFVAGQFGNTVPDSAEQRQQLIYGYDVIRNGRMDRDEVLGFLNARGARLVQVSGSYTEERPDPPLFTWLDLDRSGMLEADELSELLERARVLDRNDDWVIERGELPGDTSSQPDTPQLRRARRNAPRSAASLTAEMDWSRLLYAIEERYAYGSPVQAVDLLREELFVAVDEDEDGYWSRHEVAHLLDLPADATIEVSFGEELRLALLESQPSVEDIKAGARQTTFRMTFASTPLEFELRDASRSPFGDDEQYMQIWQQWDTTSDGYLDLDEYRQVQAVFQQLSFESIDMDGDEKLYPAEVSKALLRRQAAQRSRLSFAVNPDDSLLWSRLDRNQDDRLSERELRSASTTLAEFIDDSGTLDPSRIASSINVRISRGENQAANQNQNEARETTVDAPDWFKEMDRNRDGELARHEFLGTDEQFRQLDQDESGFVEPPEASRVNP